MPAITDALRRRVLDEIRRDQVVDLASNLIRVPSFTTEETAVARFLLRYFGECGVPAELQEVEPGRFQVLARLRGRGGAPSLMLNGHIDIDPIVHGGTRDPWTPTVDGDRLYGHGIFNMKGGVTAIVSAAAALRRAGVALRGDVLVACVVGELQGGVGTQKLLDTGVRTDYAVVTEPSGADVITTTHCGVVHLAVHTKGFSQHISRKEQGIDAIDKMLDVIDALNAMEFSVPRRADMPGAPRVLVGSIIGGRGRDYELRGPYGVSDFCTAIVDIRFLPGQSLEDVRRDVERALDGVARRDPQLSYEIELPPGKPFKGAVMPMPAMDVARDARIVGLVRQNYRAVTGMDIAQIGVVEPMCYGANDGSRLAAAGIECCRYGPGDGIKDPATRYHIGADQFISIDDMVTVTRTLALTALDICV
jgi:acetylornithine deacetylase